MAIDTYPPQNVTAQTPVLGFAQTTTSQTGITSEVDLTGLSVTITVPAGRRIKITAGVRTQGSAVDSGLAVYIYEVGGTYLQSNPSYNPYASSNQLNIVMTVVTPSAGTHTYKLTAQVSGSGTGSATSSTQNPSWLLVEDITGSQLPVLPQSVPVGVIGYAQITANFTGVGVTPVDIPGLSTNVVIPDGRQLEVAVFLPALWGATSQTDDLIITMDGATITISETTNVVQGFYASRIISPSAGAHTFIARAATSSGSRTVSASATNPAYIIVKDVTATPAPGQGAPGSTLGYAEMPDAGQVILGAQGTAADLTGLSVTVTVPAGRRIRISSEVRMGSATATDVNRLSIFEGAQLLDFIDQVSNPGNLGWRVDRVLTPSAGTHTYKSVASKQVGSGNISVISNAAQYPAYILVEDITGAVWPVGSTVTAGMVASEAWTPYTPTLTQSATLTKTVNYAKYQRIGRTIFATVSLVISSAGTAGQHILVGLPVAAASLVGAVGGFRYTDIGTAIYTGTAFNDGASTTAVKLFRSGDGDSLGTSVTAANNDAIEMFITYEAAS